MLVRIIEALKYLAKQNIAIRGSNFTELLNLMSILDNNITQWLKRRNCYISPDNQNELLKIMSDDVTRTIVKRILNSESYCLMIDESTDISNHEQVTFCIRLVVGVC